MKDEIKQATETVLSHPKASLVVTAAFTSNAWLDYGEPIVKGITTIVGMVVLILLAVKHAIDIKNELTKKDDDKDK